MIYSILMMSFIEKNNINNVHPEKSGVCTNLNSLYKYCCLYDQARMILNYDSVYKKEKTKHFVAHSLFPISIKIIRFIYRFATVIFLFFIERDFPFQQ